MRVTLTLVSVIALAAGVFASPACKRDNSTDPPSVFDGRCTPCNDHMNECMGKWPCWFYNCQPDCNKEVCEQLPDCRQGCGYHC